MSDSPPPEVKLAEDVKACRDCRWFWPGGSRLARYGPYPAFDFLNECPAEILAAQGAAPSAGPDGPWLRARIVESAFPDPGIMHGCRKAPIMTIGINPNLTAWSASAAGGTWIYPSFKSLTSYAYYYRHFTEYQQTLSASFVHSQIAQCPTHQLLAEDRGFIKKICRGSAYNYIQLIVTYFSGANAGTPRDMIHEIVWQPDERWVLLQDVGSPENTTTWFNKGALLAGVLNMQPGMRVDLYSTPDPYYHRMAPILEHFKKLTGLEQAPLSVGEDVSQHDMVACASPGWQAKYDIPTEGIAARCVSEKGWLVRQFLQSQPAVAIISGTSALKMFRSAFAPFMTLDPGDQDVYQLLQQTCGQATHVDITVGAVSFKTRLIVTPHFSYDDGFSAAARLSTTAWNAFQKDFPADANLLNSSKRVTELAAAAGEPLFLIALDPDDQLSVRGKAVLSAYFLDPTREVAQALAREYGPGGSLELDPMTGRLCRAQGPCRFCDNERWKFPEGCLYGKPKLEPLPVGQLEEATQYILRSASPQP